MIEYFDIDAYCAAMKKFNECAEQYLVIEGMNCYMPESAPEEAKEAYKNSMYWVEKKMEWERVTGEHFR